jgi:hypothetical protein
MLRTGPRLRPTYLLVRGSSSVTVSCVCTRCSTVSLVNTTIKLFISGSYPILVLATVLGRPRNADAKNVFSNTTRVLLNLVSDTSREFIGALEV